MRSPEHLEGMSSDSLKYSLGLKDELVRFQSLEMKQDSNSSFFLKPTVTVGTSETQKVGNIYLQLKLVVRKGNSTENVYMELTLPQFYNFLHEMERAKASMECFS
ncbi:COMM domain-containing protein 7-like [Hippoglossus hippoglossus]|uniref:COMM domain-containing protein 7-like n=1 Tax=Hippoglossus hippoglossus TaxID=8267 RepID=UPI00148BA564|nr:COMM domain-containing protein 7-like [Hippoglossus hippoglossus]